jgi:outer membrane protein assembly factor BamA
MSRFSALLCVLAICLLPISSRAQKGAIALRSIDSNQSLLLSLADMPKDFEDPGYAFEFLKELIPSLQEKGYLAASIDSIYVENDLYGAYVFLGKQYKWAKLSFDSIPNSLWAQASIDPHQWENEKLNPKRLANVSEKLLRWCEDNGYPFARVWLGDVQVNNEGGVNASMMLDKGAFRKIDSVNIKGTAGISKSYMMHALDIFEGEDYNEKKLKTVTNRLHEIPFLEQSEPWRVNFKLTTTEVDLYLQEKKANQLNAIIGLLPNSVETGKFLLTADVVFAFRNILSIGESIDLSYQQLQYRTPHLKASTMLPFLLNSPFGIDANFDFFRRDTFFRRTSFQLGLRYQLTATDYVRIFYQGQSNRLIYQDVAFVRANKRLPENIDVSANGGGFEMVLNRTDYRPNPVKGWRGRALTSALIRKIRRSDAISDINDGSGFDYSTLYDSLEKRKYQYRVEGDLAYFLPLGKKATFMTAYYGGWISGNNLFQNELYQVGGFRLMRGFDEQSIYTNQYHILTLELRLLLDRNSNVYLFSDNGYIYSQYSGFNRIAFYNGFGAGTSLQVRSGLFTINYALGRTDGTQIQLRQSKIHFGYVAYF